MKPMIVISTLATVVTLGTLAFAHGGGGGHMFDRMDQNKDGKVTTAEADAVWKARFTELDKNKDNVLVADELKGARHPKKFGKADTNNDGKITLAEAQAKATAMFTKFDKNKDKILTRDEMPARGRGQGHGHGRGDCSKA